MVLKNTDYVKVRREGGTIVLTVGKRIPPDWKLVSIKERKCSDENKRILEIKKVA